MNATESRYEFTASVAAGRAHTLQVHYDNDDSVNGEVRKTVAGIQGTGVDDNVITHNDIDHSARYGISLKDYGGTIEILRRSSTDTGTLIQGNWIEGAGGLATNAADQWLYGQKGFGIYLDDMAGGVTVTGNFLKETGWAAVQIHGGDNNVVTNNFAILGSNREDFIRVEWAPKHGDAGLPRNNSITGNLIDGTLPLDDYVELLTANNPVIAGNVVHNLPTYGDHDVTGKLPWKNRRPWSDGRRSERGERQQAPAIAPTFGLPEVGILLIMAIDQLLDADRITGMLHTRSSAYAPM